MQTRLEAMAALGSAMGWQMVEDGRLFVVNDYSTTPFESRPQSTCGGIVNQAGFWIPGPDAGMAAQLCFVGNVVERAKPWFKFQSVGTTPEGWTALFLIVEDVQACVFAGPAASDPAWAVALTVVALLRRKK
jgi:hypothetical protein